MVRGRIYVGTSGFSYPHWRGLFYPPGLSTRGELSFLASRFAAVELNHTFYRLPDARVVERWRQAVPPGFLFAVKASRFLTHVKRLHQVEAPLARMLAALEPLGTALGPFLFQLPPDLPVDAPRLALLLAELPHGVRAAIEPRHPSWLGDEVIDLLERHGAALVLHDRWIESSPGRPRRWPRTFHYRRFHGPRAGGGYSDEVLERCAAECVAAQELGLDAFAFFNNDAQGQAPEDALRLLDLLGDRAERPRLTAPA